MKPETKLPWSTWIGGLCLLPVLYVFSVFPVGWVSYQFGRGFPAWLIAFNGPLGWAVEECEWLGASLNWIAEQMGIR